MDDEGGAVAARVGISLTRHVTYAAPQAFSDCLSTTRIPYMGTAYMETGLTQQVVGWTAAATAVIGAAGGAAVLRRRLSRDKTEMTKDRVESEFVVLLLKERDEALASAREAWRVRQVDAESIARLQSQNLFQEQEIQRLKQEFGAFKRLIARLYPATRAFLESDFPPPHDFAPDLHEHDEKGDER